jgi:hypothetical protein
LPNLLLPQKFSFNFNASQAQTIVITWLEYYAGDVNKRYKILNFQKGENLIKISFDGLFCACSMVVSGENDITDIETAIEQINQGMLKPLKIQ